RGYFFDTPIVVVLLLEEFLDELLGGLAVLPHREPAPPRLWVRGPRGAAEADPPPRQLADVGVHLVLPDPAFARHRVRHGLHSSAISELSRTRASLPATKSRQKRLRPGSASCTIDTPRPSRDRAPRPACTCGTSDWDTARRSRQGCRMRSTQESHSAHRIRKPRTHSASRAISASDRPLDRWISVRAILPLVM